MTTLDFLKGMSIFLLTLGLSSTFFTVLIMYHSRFDWGKLYYSLLNSLALMFVGLSLRQVTSLYWRLSDTASCADFMNDNIMYLFTISLMITALGTANYLRAITYEKYGNKAWISTLIISCASSYMFAVFF